VYRPGGSALNSGQVGSYRAAVYISKKYSTDPVGTEEFIQEVRSSVEENLSFAAKWLANGNSAPNKKYLGEIRRRMSFAGGIIREKAKVKKASEEALVLVNELPVKIGAGSVRELADSFLLSDHCITHYIYLEAISKYISMGGRSRGSYIVTDSELQRNSEKIPLGNIPELCFYDRDVENRIIEVAFRDNRVVINMKEIRDLPRQDLWFEKVWKEYIEDNYLDC
jgi:succinate dehydrogenase/fumarate reductase flavoprotein subunit